MLLTVIALAFICFFTLIFYALHRKGYVRAIFKGLTFHVEFEADDEKPDRKK